MVEHEINDLIVFGLGKFIFNDLAVFNTRESGTQQRSPGIFL